MFGRVIRLKQTKYAVFENGLSAILTSELVLTQSLFYCTEKDKEILT